jgi:non-ribosomal peptide synthetase component F
LVKLLKSGVSIFLEYRTSFVPTEQAKNIASTVETILSSIVSSPSLRVRDLNTLSQRSQLQIEKWNSEPFPRIDNTIHGTIAQSVARQPDAEAVCSWDGSLTYQELDERASRVASHLIELGVGAEVIVPLCFDKSKWNVVAMLGVLMAGGACT